MKKFLITLLAVIMAGSMIFGLTACDGANDQNSDTEIPADFKIGLITLHDKNSTYDKNFINAMEEVQKELGLSNEQVIIASGIDEGEVCYEKAIELAEAGCKVIIADSFGHEAYMIKAAKQKPDVLFAHATGTKAHTENLPNYVNAFASIYEGRYLAGVVAGMKLKQIIDSGDNKSAKVGYIGAFTYAEVISGYTSWFLGVRSIVPEATMEVTFTGSWYNETAENNAAKALIANGCRLISQHADSMGAPNACEEAGIPNVSYNGSTAAACPDTFLVSSRINWAPYYKYLIDCKVNNKTVDKDYTGTIATDSVQITSLGTAVAPGTAEKVAEVKAKLAAGTLKVFDTNTYTVNGQKQTTYLADVDDTVGQDGKSDYIHETEAVKDGYFHESEYRSAPYFDFKIDGITLLDVNYGD